MGAFSSSCCLYATNSVVILLGAYVRFKETCLESTRRCKRNVPCSCWGALHGLCSWPNIHKVSIGAAAFSAKRRSLKNPMHWSRCGLNAGNPADKAGKHVGRGALVENHKTRRRKPCSLAAQNAESRRTRGRWNQAEPAHGTLPPRVCRVPAGPAGVLMMLALLPGGDSEILGAMFLFQVHPGTAIGTFFE